MPKSIEKEFSFIVNDEETILFPEHIFDFYITKKKKIDIIDFNYEKTKDDDKFRNAGIRVRTIIDQDNKKIELTYKQYLGTQNGMNKFIEITEDIPNFSGNIFLFSQINNLMISDKLKTILLEMNKLCIMQPGIKIENTRNLYYYTHKNCMLEIADEKITYLLGGKSYKEKMLEIEIISDTYDFQSVREFVDYFLTKYKLITPLEGKSERGKKHLSK